MLEKLPSTLRLLRTLLYWGLPPLLLYLIIRRIDLPRLKSLLAEADLALILGALALTALVVSTGAVRWHLLAKRFDCLRLPLRRTIAEYWASLSVGIFVPGTLGSDAYRVLLSGRRTGRLLPGAIVVVLEKAAALFTSAALIAALYPFIEFRSLPEMLTLAVHAIYAAAAGVAIVGVIAAVAHRAPWVRGTVAAVASSIASAARSVVPDAISKRARTHQDDHAAPASVTAAFSPRVVFPAVGLSLAIQFLSAVQVQVFFQAVGYDIPFLVNLFVGPLLFFVFMLPISFGSLGVREGAYILFYSAFGVPPETALLVSFCGLFGTLASYAIGGYLFFHRWQGGAHGLGADAG